LRGYGRVQYGDGWLGQTGGRDGTGERWGGHRADGRCGQWRRDTGRDEGYGREQHKVSFKHTAIVPLYRQMKIGQACAMRCNPLARG
jgi:hypothetical protein